jgi:RNA 3'-terminal phosphate cyclase (ATP)
MLLPAALASEGSEYPTAEVSLRLTTNAWVIEKFGVARVRVDEDEKVVRVEPI